MSIKFYIVRHGIKEKAIGDVPITLEGIMQARATANYLASLPISAIVSSPLRRAQETAHYISLKTKTKIITDNRLRERANWGDVPGQTFEEFVEIWDKCTREPDYIPPVGESVKQACNRFSSLVFELVQDFPDGGHIVIVTHGGLITDYLVNTFQEHELNRFHSQFIEKQSTLVSECSITQLNYDRGGRYTIDCFATVNHLA